MDSTAQVDGARTSDAALLAEFAQSESGEAFRALVERHTEMVYNTCLRKLRGNRGLAEEATQSVFILLARKAHRLRSCRNLGYWLYRAANLTVLNMLRQETRRERREELAMQDAEQTAYVAGPEKDLWQDLRERLDDAVRALPRKQQQAIVMHYFQGRPAEEIAAAVGCPPGTVRSRIQLARGKLRKRLARHVTVSASLLLACLGAEEAPAGLVDSCYAAGIESLAAGSAAAGGPALLATQVEKYLAVMQAAKVASLLSAAVAITGALYLIGPGTGQAQTPQQAVASTPAPITPVPGERAIPVTAAPGAGKAFALEDRFDNGLGNWQVVAQNGTGRIEAAGGTASYVRTTSFMRDGREDEAALLDGTILGKRVIGMRLKVPIEAQSFSLTFDELPLVPGHSYRQYLGLGEKTTRSGGRGRWTAAALSDRDVGKWGTFRTEYVRGKDAEGRSIVKRKMFFNGRLVVDDSLYTESRTLSLNHSVGMVAIDNVVVEEMTPDPIPPSARLENGGEE